VALWPEVSAFVDQIPDPYDRRYVTLKTMAGSSFAAAITLDVSTATTWADQLLDIGASTGNRRATALCHLTHVVACFALGDFDEAILAAGRAVAVGADPVHAMVAENWAIGIATFIGNTETAADWIDKHDSADQLGYALNRQIIDIFRAELDVLNGDLSRGDKRLQALRSACETLGDRWLMRTIDSFYAAMPARIASGEAEASTMQALRNPGFARRHGVRAAHKARARLTGLIEICEYPSMTPFLELELAKLEASQGRIADAYAHAERVRELLADHPESPHYREASALIAQTSTEH
jgi:SAM-dependent methyltransferase